MKENENTKIDPYTNIQNKHENCVVFSKQWVENLIISSFNTED